MMRIGIFTELYVPHVGGQEIRYAEMASVLIAQGHSVDVYCIRHSKDVPSQEILDGVRVSRYPLAENYKKPLFKRLKRAVGPLLRYSLWAARKARAGPYDLMLFNQWPLAHVALTRKSSRGKIVLDWCEVRSGSFYRALMQSLPKRAGRNVAVSRAVARTVENHSGKRVYYLPSGISASRYRGLARQQRSGILYLGRVTEHKNIELLIEAFSELKRKGYAGGLTIAGAGPHLESVRCVAASTSEAADIHFSGFVSDDLKVRLLAQSEVLVITSQREGFPRVVAEAMASGLPTVTVDYPDNGTRDVVLEYGVGLVARPESSNVAEAVVKVLQDWDWFSSSCLTHAGSLDWNILVRQLLEPEQKDAVAELVSNESSTGKSTISGAQR